MGIAKATRLSAEAHDFAPGLLAIQESPPARLPRALLYSVSALLILLLLWANYGRLDIVAVADGKLVPDTYLKIVQPTDSGVVKEILVKEGERVKAGQVLIRMDTALSDSDMKALTSDYQNKHLALRRIDAQLGGSALTPRPDEPAELFAQVHAQYAANRQSYENALAQERATLDKVRHDLTGAEAVKEKLVQILPHYREQDAVYEKLAREGFVGKLMYTDKQRERIEKEQDLQAQIATIAAAHDTITQEQQKIAQISADYRRQLQTERVDTAAQLEKAQEDLAKQAHRSETLELKAPQDGVVKDMATHTLGTVTGPGTILMTLVPQDENLRAEVWVKNDDIGFVREKQRAKIKLAAFTFQKYGMLDGEVAFVSADSADPANNTSGSATNGQSQGQGQTKGGTEPLAYRTLLNLKTQVLEVDGERYRLSPGMQVSVEINLGTRTVMEYLLSPVAKAFQEAGRER